MKRSAQLLFLDFFTVIAIIKLVAYYGFDAGVPEYRITAAWAVIGLQVIVNVANWWIVSRKKPDDQTTATN